MGRDTGPKKGEPMTTTETTIQPQRTAVTANVVHYIERFDPLYSSWTLEELISRHCEGDWGAVCAEDARVNDDALLHGGRCMSVFELSDGKPVWVISDGVEISGGAVEAYATTVLFPSDY